MPQSPEEQSLAEPITSAEEFLTAVRKRRVSEIIRPEDALAFAGNILNQNPPEGFLGRLLDSVHYVGQDEFWRDINQLALNLRDFLKGEPYASYVGLMGKSSPWILEQLLNARDHDGMPILHAPVAIFADEDGQVNGQPVTVARAATINQALASYERSGIPIIYPDDVMLSGQQMELMHDFVFDPESPRSIIGAVLYTAEPAYDRIPNTHDISLINVRSFDSAGKHFTRDDLNFIANIAHGSRAYAGVATQVIYSTGQGQGKITDQVMGMITGQGGGMPPLITPESLAPPYR